MIYSHQRTSNLLIILLFFLWGCQEENRVNEEYVDSPKYEDFRRDLERERNLRLETIEEFIHQLAECNLPDNMDLPLTISADNIASLISKAPGHCIEGRMQNSTTYLGNSPLPDIDLLWLLVESHSVYEEKELILIIRKDHEVLEYLPVGVFNRSISTVEETLVNAIPQNNGAVISIKTTISREYPIKQERTVEATYTVNALGQIRKTGS